MRTDAESLFQPKTPPKLTAIALMAALLALGLFSWARYPASPYYLLAAVAAATFQISILVNPKFRAFTVSGKFTDNSRLLWGIVLWVFPLQLGAMPGLSGIPGLADQICLVLQWISIWFLAFSVFGLAVGFWMQGSPPALSQTLSAHTEQENVIQQ